MRRLAAVLILLGVFTFGILATASWANPEEACKKWPNNKQCPPTTTTVPTEPPTTTEPPPTTTDEEPPTTTEEEPPPPNNGGTTGGTEPPPTNEDLPFTGLPAGLFVLLGLGLIGSGALLLRRHPAK